MFSRMPLIRKCRDLARRSRAHMCSLFGTFSTENLRRRRQRWLRSLSCQFRPYFSWCVSVADGGSMLNRGNAGIRCIPGDHGLSLLTLSQWPGGTGPRVRGLWRARGSLNQADSFTRFAIISAVRCAESAAPSCQLVIWLQWSPAK